jgi:hypothetical protein
VHPHGTRLAQAMAAVLSLTVNLSATTASQVAADSRNSSKGGFRHRGPLRIANVNGSHLNPHTTHALRQNCRLIAHEPASQPIDSLSRQPHVTGSPPLLHPSVAPLPAPLHRPAG